MPKSTNTLSKNSDDIIFQEVRRRLNDLEKSSKTVETKGALVLTFVGAIIAGLVNSSWFIMLPAIYSFLILLSLSITAILALGTVLVRKYQQDPDPGTLIKNYSDKSEATTKGQLITNFEHSYRYNKKVVTDKAKFLKAALIALATTIVILALSIFLSTHPLIIQKEHKWQNNHRKILKPVPMNRQ